MCFRLSRQWFTTACGALFMSAGLSVAAPPSSDYTLLYADEFTGNALNEKDWNYRLGSRWITSLDRKENVTVSGGELHIATRSEMINGKLWNSGGGIISRHQFSYGYYETSSKPYMGGRGTHSTFWQFGNIFEIDGYEIDSKSAMACHNLYIRNVPWVHRANRPFTLNPDGSYLCAYEYTPQGVVFYDQGQVVAKADWTELTAAQAVWLTALNGTGKVDGPGGETTFEYFRYYSKDYPGVNRLPNGSFEYDQDKGNPAFPKCWQLSGGGGQSAMVVEGQAARDRYKLRHGRADKPFEVATWQSLEYLMNGDYELTAMVRGSGGLETAQIRVANYGGPDIGVNIPASETWTPIAIPRIPVSNHGVTIRLESKGNAGQWVEFDDVRFQKPALPGQTPTCPPFQLIRDPIWSLAPFEPISFTGDGKFYFFDRTVGIGEAITVSFVMNPVLRANTLPIARVPKTGTAGWAVQLTEKGQVVFRIGSSASHKAVVAAADYPTNKETRVTCVFDRGTAKLFVDGVLKKKKSGIRFTTQDTTAAGRLGSVNTQYEAVDDVIAPSGDAVDGITGKIPRCRNYAGTLRDIRVHNRALSDAEVTALACTLLHADVSVPPSGGRHADKEAAKIDRNDVEGVEVDQSLPEIKKVETPEERDARMAWWREARFGVMLTWGVHSIPAEGEWYMRANKMPVAEYKKFSRQFNPVRYDAQEWATLFKDAGMKYVVLICKHHDGFALWPSNVTDWDIADASPYGKDLVGPLVEACHKEGLKFGAYYSHAQDWTHRGGATSEPNWDPAAQSGDYDAYINGIAVPQLAELAAYKPDLLWWDTPVNITKERADRLMAPLKPLKNLIFNSRLGGGYVGDFAVAENSIPAYPPSGDWETCMTLGRKWSYATGDKDFKSPKELVSKLAEVVCKNGNLILGVGPKPDGTIPGHIIERLKAVGQWLGHNGEAIYGTTGGPFPYLSYGYATQKKDRLYLIVFDWPKDGFLRVPVLSEVKSARMLGTSENLVVKTDNQRVTVAVPSQAPDPIASVVVLKLGGDLVARPNPTQYATVKASVNGGTAPNILKFSRTAPWLTPKGTSSATLEFTFEKPVVISSIRLEEPDKWPRIRQDYVVEAEVNGAWKLVAEGATEGVGVRVDFEPVTTSAIWLKLTGKTGAPGLAKVLFVSPE
jgi:alpha-L-fucosidase